MRCLFFFFFKQKTAYEMRISDWSRRVLFRSFLIDQKYLARPIFRTLNSDAGLTLSENDVNALSSAIDVPEQILERLGTDTQRNLKILSAVEDQIGSASCRERVCQYV